MERIAAEKGIARENHAGPARGAGGQPTAVDDLHERSVKPTSSSKLSWNSRLEAQPFAKLDELAPPHAVLGTNTSSLSIADIAGATSRPERVIGMHFFNPVPIMKLLELVRHDRTSDATVAIAEAAGEAMGKTTILVKDVPGFATSRLGVVLGNEAIRMLADGVASAKDIDTAMVLGYKHPMGPLALTDLVGLDVRRDILLNLQRSFNDDSYAPHPLLERLVAEGRLGKKTGKGIYDWSTGQAEETELD